MREAMRARLRRHRRDPPLRVDPRGRRRGGPLPVRPRPGDRRADRPPLRRDRRRAVALPRGRRRADDARRDAGPRRRRPHDRDGLLQRRLRVQAAPDPEAGRRDDRREPARQHRPPGPLRHLPEAARDDPGQGARRGRRERRLRPRLDHGSVVPAGPRLDARRAVDARPRRPDDRPGRALPSLRDGHDEPGPRRRGAVGHRGGQAGELRGLRLRRRGRGDPPPTGGALGRPQWPGRRRDRTGTERRARRREPPSPSRSDEWRGERPGRCRRWHQWNRRVAPEMAGAGPNRAWTEEGADR